MLNLILPALSQHNFNRFFLAQIQSCRLVAAVEMFAIRYVINYILHLLIFQTTSVNAR